MYPDINDPDFQFLIAQKLEFRNLSNPDGLYDHQEFVRRFMSPYTPYKSLILFHNLGSGKSIACIATAVDHYLYDGKTCIIVTKGQSGTDNFLNQIKRYRDMSSKRDEWDPSIFKMKHYMSFSHDIYSMSDISIQKEYSNKIFVLDEVHNVRYFVRDKGSVYGSIIKVLNVCDNIKIFLATATPMTDNPDQLISLLGMCNNTRQATSEEPLQLETVKFSIEDISAKLVLLRDKSHLPNPLVRNERSECRRVLRRANSMKEGRDKPVSHLPTRVYSFQETAPRFYETDSSTSEEPYRKHQQAKLDNPVIVYNLAGIISYNPFVPDKPRSVYVGNAYCVLTDNQDETIVYLSDIIRYQKEEPQENKTNDKLLVYTSEMVGHQREVYCQEQSRCTPNDIYRSLTHISLFCSDNGMYGRDITEKMMTKIKKISTITPLSTGKTKEIKYTKHSIKPELKHLMSGPGLRNCSSKYSALIDILNNSVGNVFVFVEEVRGSGLLLLACILEHHGYELYTGESPSKMQKASRYTLCVGSLDICPNGMDRLDGFNSELNKNGEYVRILLGSKVIGESITLLNVRQFHCITPHWNDSTINQAVGRVVRNGSHSALSIAERSVDIYVHAAVIKQTSPSPSLEPLSPSEGPRGTSEAVETVDLLYAIDVIKISICQRKQYKIKQVEQAMIDNAVDKYCIAQPSEVPVTDYETFAAVYIDYHINYILEQVSHEISKDKLIDIYDLSRIIDIHPIICKEAVCRIIRDNMPIVVHPGLILYLRAYKNTIFTVTDPSVPYVTLPHPQAVGPPSKAPVPPTSEEIQKLSGRRNWSRPLHGFINIDYRNRIGIVDTFRHMPLRDKIKCLETCIYYGRFDILQHIKSVYACIDNAFVHLLWYRDLESSYTSANPVPKKPEGRTRYMSESIGWVTLSIDQELQKDIFAKYKELIDICMEEVDKHDIYGIISTIDGCMRLRLRNTEDYGLSSEDHRFVKRGRSIKSIKKNELQKIWSSLAAPSELHKASMSISDITNKIDRKLIELGLYVIL